MNYSKEEAASTMSNLSYLRPVCAIFAGLIADKISATRLSIYLFITMDLKYTLSPISAWKGTLNPLPSETLSHSFLSPVVVECLLKHLIYPI